MTGIRHIAAAHRVACFVTAEFEHRVSMWSLAERSLVGELDTVLDFGGRRLALCGVDAPIVVAGAWERHGICAYASDGTQLWQRKDLRQPQHISPAGGGALVTACFDERPMHVLAVESGETVAKVSAIRSFYDSPFAEVGLGEADGHVALVSTEEWNTRWKAPVEGFATLSAAAAPGAFAVADVVGFDEDGRSSVSCLDLAGELLWRWSAPPDVNCPALAWDDEDAEWVGVLSHVNNERPDTLVRWSPDGEVVGEYPLALYAACEFLASGRHLVTSDGEVLDSRDGTLVWRLP